MAQNTAHFMDAETRLRRLWKGALLVGVAGGYVLLVSALLLQHSWQAALLAAFFVVVSQFLRYIASDVDRIGWQLSERKNEKQGAEAATQSEGAVRYQARLFRGLVALAQLVNVALVVQAFALGGVLRAIATLLGLALIEVLFSRIRKVNREVTFEQASYGFSDRPLLHDGASATGPWDEAANERLQRKLETLRQMAEAGEISQQAYQKARDKWLVRSVMRDDAAMR